MNPNITFTETASLYIKSMLEKQQGIGFRLSVKKTGCSGYSYLPSIVHDVNPSDIKFQIDHQVTVYVDTVWLELLQGVHVDFIEEEKTGLKQKRLLFTNPNETSRCGCGESFHIE